MKKSTKVLMAVGFISIIMGILIYIAYMNYVDYYSYNISSEDESSTKALLSLGIKRNHELTSFTLYAKYDEDNIEYIGQNVLLDRTDILEKIQKVDTDGLKVDYHLTSIPYDRIIDYEAIKFDLKKVSLREIDNIVDYLGLKEYIKGEKIILEIDDLKNNKDFVYNWIIDAFDEWLTRFRGKINEKMEWFKNRKTG